jgi:hypothetical protein
MAYWRVVFHLSQCGCAPQPQKTTVPTTSRTSAAAAVAAATAATTSGVGIGDGDADGDAMSLMCAQRRTLTLHSLFRTPIAGVASRIVEDVAAARLHVESLRDRELSGVATLLRDATDTNVDDAAAADAYDGGGGAGDADLEALWCH